MHSSENATGADDRRCARCITVVVLVVSKQSTLTWLWYSRRRRSKPVFVDFLWTDVSRWSCPQENSVLFCCLHGEFQIVMARVGFVDVRDNGQRVIPVPLIEKRSSFFSSSFSSIQHMNVLPSYGPRGEPIATNVVKTVCLLV